MVYLAPPLWHAHANMAGVSGVPCNNGRQASLPLSLATGRREGEGREGGREASQGKKKGSLVTKGYHIAPSPMCAGAQGLITSV